MVTDMPCEQREMQDPEENINLQKDKSLDTGLETILEIHKTEIE